MLVLGETVVCWCWVRLLHVGAWVGCCMLVLGETVACWCLGENVACWCWVRLVYCVRTASCLVFISHLGLVQSHVINNIIPQCDT